MHSEKDSSELEVINDSNSGFIEYIFDLGTAHLPEMLGLRALPSLIHTIRRHGFSDFSDKTIKFWVVDMLLDGLKGSTVKRYLGAVHTLFKQWAASSARKTTEEIFTVSLSGYDTDSSAKRLNEVENNLIAAQRFTKMTLKHDSPAFIYAKIFQYLLFNPFASLSDIVSLKYSDERPQCQHLDDIVTSMRNAPQAKYVFPLMQGKRRAPAIIKDLLVELHATGRRAGLKFGESFSRESITSLWITAAIKEDISYSEIRGLIQNFPVAYSFLSLIEPAEVTEERRIDILNTVAYAISNKNPGWFVLRLRSGVTPEKIKERLKEKESPLQHQIVYYYPMRKVKKVEKKKVTTVDTPIIPGILFMRLPHDRVTPLIGIIGDLAWCYRTSANPSSPYSVIPQAEMRIFQRTVGAFTKDIEMEIVSQLPPLNVGDEVMIEDGSLLDGQVATIRKVRSKDGNLTYTLRLSETAFIKWKDISLPASHLSKINK